VSDREHRIRSDRAGHDHDEEIEDRAIERFKAGDDWLTALTGAARELGAGAMRTRRRRPPPGRVSLTAAPGAYRPYAFRMPGKSAITAGLRGAQIQRRAEAAPVSPDAAASLVSSLTGGAPLPEELRRELERALGVDLAAVRVHTGGDADLAARALGARAFAVGQDIGFRAGTYEPDRPEGVRLIAHEVAHTVQTRGASAPADGASSISQPEDASEREADAFAARFVGQALRTPERAPALGTIATPPRSPAGVPPGWEAGAPAQSLWSLANGAPAAALPGLVHRSCILDYADPAHPEYDPSRISDARIAGTNEYRSLMNPALVWQTRDRVTTAEAKLACRLILRVLRTGGHVNWQTQARTYVMQAREQLASMHQAEGLAGGLHWTNQEASLTNTAFGRWLLSGGPEPTAATGDMNCWELVMFSAYLQGYTTKPRLAAIYTTFAAGMAADLAAGVTAFETAIRRGPEQVYAPADPDTPRPVAGDLVIFGTVATHAAVATGNYPGGKVEVMSLWTQNARHTFRTTVEDLRASGPFRFFSPHW